MVLLVLVVAGLSWLTVATHGRALGFADLTRRASFVIAYLLVNLVVVAIAELGSVRAELSRWTVAGALLVVAIGEVVLCWPALRRLTGRTRGRRRRARARPGVDQAVAGVVLAVFAIVLAVMGFLYRPFNTDSMVYHLARVEHWIQAGSVGPFAAHFLAQVELAPLSSYQFLVLKLVSGTDRWDGYVELTAAVVCVLGASELARRLGLGGRGQAFTALLVATLPNLLLEATSTTNNLFGASIAVGALVVLTSAIGAGGWPSRGLSLGVVTGLAWLAKGTLIVMVGPAALVLVAVAVVRAWREHGPAVVVRRSAGAVVLGSVGLIAVAGPFLGRNLMLFGGVGGPVTDTTIVAHVTPEGAAGNVIRSVSAQFLVGGESGPLAAFREALTGPLERLNDAIGPSPSEAADYVFPPDVVPFGDAADWSMTSRFEDVGANPWHTLLLVAALLVLAVAAVRRPEARLPFALAAALCVGFLAFAITGRWSIYASRYYLPVLVLWCPLIAVALGRLRPQRPRVWLSRAVAGLLVVAALPLLFDNYTRPLVSADWRTDTDLERYFARAGADDGQEARDRAQAYDAATRAIVASGCRRVGLASRVFIEYPLWVGLQERGWDGRIYDIDVPNVTSEYTPAGFEPCAVVVDQSTVIPGAESPPTTFGRLVPTEFGPLTVWLRPGRAGSEGS